MSKAQETRDETAEANEQEGTEPEDNGQGWGSLRQLVALGLEKRYVQDGGRVFAILTDHGVRQCLPVRSSAFRSWLREAVNAKWDTLPTSKAMADAVAAIEDYALRHAPHREVRSRVARGFDGAIYIDLGTEDWTCARVTGEGWEVVEHPSFGPHFYRNASTQPLPMPVGGGDPLALQESFLNVVTEDDRRLAIVWQVAALDPEGPYTVAAFIGPQGSAKSCGERALVATVDPVKARERGLAPTSLQALPVGERDLVSKVNRAHVIAFDNVSNLPDWLSDMLCIVATGGDLGGRKMYTDMDDASIFAMAPVALNGISAFIARGDLADRTILLRTQHLGGEGEPPVEEEELFWTRYREAHPCIFGALLDTLSGVMRERDNVKLSGTFRMADFARTGVTVERVLGWPEGSFVESYEANSKHITERLLENDVVATTLLRFMEVHAVTVGAEWRGKATTLRDDLAATFPRNPPADFPKSPRGLTSELQRLQPLLPAYGLTVEWADPDRNKQREVVITLDTELLARGGDVESASGLFAGSPAL